MRSNPLQPIRANDTKACQVPVQPNISFVLLSYNNTSSITRPLPNEYCNSKQIILIHLSSTICNPRASRDILKFRYGAPNISFMCQHNIITSSTMVTRQNPQPSDGDMIVLRAPHIGFDSPFSSTKDATYLNLLQCGSI